MPVTTAFTYDQLLEYTDGEDARWRAWTIVTFPTLTAGTLTASKHKIASNVFLHGIRHWAQIASVLRAAGFRDQWGHDMLLSPLEM